MNDVVSTVTDAVESFRAAREAMRSAFSIKWAVEVVRAVLDGRIPRRGVLPDGCEYFVHGVGYTVVVGSGGQVHLDATDRQDMLKVWDLALYLEDAGPHPIPTIDQIKAACQLLARDGTLIMINDKSYILP